MLTMFIKLMFVFCYFKLFYFIIFIEMNELNNDLAELKDIFGNSTKVIYIYCIA